MGSEGDVVAEAQFIAALVAVAAQLLTRVPYTHGVQLRASKLRNETSMAEALPTLSRNTAEGLKKLCVCSVLASA